MRKEIIGDAILYCADFRDVLDDIGQVDHVITDAPYEDELHNAVGKIRRNDGKQMPTEFRFEGVNAGREEYARLLVEKSSGWLLIFTLAEGVRAWRDDIQAAGGKYDTCLAWVKPDASPRFNGQGPARGFECAVTAWCGKGYRSWNAGGKRGVYTHLVNGPTRHGIHDTEKPLSLMAELVADFTNPGDVIFDPFAGSGTTGVGALAGGRKFIGVEKDERYFNVMCERISEAALHIPLFTETISNKARKKQEAADAERLSIPLFGDSE